jgi:hypothetical protein
MSQMSAIDGPGSCGISHPFKVAAFASGSVGLTSKVTLGCPIIPSIDGWLNEVVQPAAATYFGTSVAEVKSGSYSCRPRNNQPGAKVSEHAYGNAVDIMAFRLADGREITVVKGWKGTPEEQDFLRQVFVAACEYFTTVLGPGADMFHYDHFHLDLARHDPRGQRHYCKPVLKFTPRQDVYSRAPAGRAPQPDTWRSQQPLPEIEIDQDHDPFAVPSASRRAPLPAQPVTASRSSNPTWDLPAPVTARGAARSDPFAVSTPASAPAIPPLPPTRSQVSAPAPLPAPLPPPRYTRGYEPIPSYEPPPAQRSGPLVLQPSSRAGQPIY